MIERRCVECGVPVGSGHLSTCSKRVRAVTESAALQEAIRRVENSANGEPIGWDDAMEVAWNAAGDFFRAKNEITDAKANVAAKAGVEWACDEAELRDCHLDRWDLLDEDTRIRCRAQAHATLWAAALAD